MLLALRQARLRCIFLLVFLFKVWYKSKYIKLGSGLNHEYNKYYSPKSSVVFTKPSRNIEFFDFGRATEGC
jgi:hypothetical protein